VSRPTALAPRPAEPSTDGASLFEALVSSTR